MKKELFYSRALQFMNNEARSFKNKKEIGELKYKKIQFDIYYPSKKISKHVTL